MNLSIEYEGKCLSLPVKSDYTSMTLVERVLNHLHLYIYAVQTVNIVLKNGQELTPGDGEGDYTWNDSLPFDDIELVIVHPRQRDEDDKVLPSPFVDSYVAHQQQFDDERIAREMQETDYGMRPPPGQGQGRLGMMGQLMMDQFLDAIDREMEARHDEHEAAAAARDEEDIEPGELMMTFTAPGIGAIDVPIPGPNADAEAPVPRLGAIFQRFMQAAMQAQGAQEDVKVVCTDEELAECPLVNYGSIEEKKGTTCNICLDDFEDDTEVLVLPECEHYYHPDCITHWLMESSNKCPVCRTSRGTGKAVNPPPALPQQMFGGMAVARPPPLDSSSSDDDLELPDLID